VIESFRQVIEVRLNVSGHVTVHATEFSGQRFDSGVDAHSGCSRRLSQPIDSSNAKR
jgi:hypothetical protein